MSSDWRIGIDLGGTKSEVILLDGRSQERFRRRAPTPFGDYEGTLRLIADLVTDAEAKAGQRGIPVGVGIPGSVSRHTGRVHNANSTWLNGQRLDLDLKQRLNRAVTITNDANCLALSEATDGAARGYQTVFAAILGTGCGAGISIGGKLLTGLNGLGGEWGHNPLPWTPSDTLDDRPCFCGHRGCNETFLSGTGLAGTHRRLWGEVLDARSIVAAAAGKGDHQCATTLAHYYDHLARGLAAVVNLIDPDIIVLGGGLSNVNSLYQEVPQRLPRYVFGGEVVTPLVPAIHGDSSGVRGAAWLAAPEAGSMAGAGDQG